MHLKSLTLQGLQVLRLRHDAALRAGHHLRRRARTARASPTSSTRIAWVLGEQGAKSLRGGKMEDVIFAGTAGRPPLGRAEVTLTIDNTDGALPIDYTEVSITRRMFRYGEQRVRDQRRHLPAARHPGAALRLRHRPRDARHRRPGPARRRAARRARGPPRRSSRRPPASSSTASARRRRCASSTRCRPTSPASTTSPPSCAASSSRWAGRPRWPAGPPSSRPTCATPGCGCSPTTCVTLRATLASGDRRRGRAAGAPRGGRGGAWRGAGAARPSWRRRIAADAPRAGRGPRRPGTSCPRCRSGSAAPHQLAAERLRHLPRAPEESGRGRDPEELERRGRPSPRAGGGAARARWRTTEAGSPRPWPSRQELERQLAAAERRAGGRGPAIADRREGLARLTGQVNAARSPCRRPRPRRSTGSAAARDEARERAVAAQEEFDALQAEVDEPGRGRAGLDARHESRGGRARRRRAALVRRWPRPSGRPSRTRAGWTAREDALALGLRRKDGAGALLAAGEPAARPARHGRGAAHRRARATRRRWRPRWARLADAVAVGRPATTAAEADRACCKADDAGRAGLARSAPPRRHAGRSASGPRDADRPRRRRRGGRCPAGRAGRASPTWSRRRRTLRRGAWRTAAATWVVVVADLDAAPGRWSPTARSCAR